MKKTSKYPHVDHAGKEAATCVVCGQAFNEGELRLAFRKGAGHLHPACFYGYISEDTMDEAELFMIGDEEEFLETLQANSPGISDNEWDELNEQLENSSENPLFED